MTCNYTKSKGIGKAVKKTGVKIGKYFKKEDAKLLKKTKKVKI